MATIFRRGTRKTWYISYFGANKRVLKSLRTKDEKMARFLKKELEVKIKRGLHQDPQKVSVDSYLVDYKKQIGHRKKATNKNELYTIEDFLCSTSKKAISSFTPDDVRDYLKLYESNAARTFNNVLGSVKRFFRLAVSKGHILRNPCEGMRNHKLPQSLPRFFTDDEYMRIEKTAEGNPLFPMIVTARYSGLRLRELIHLEWQDFDWEKKIVRVENKPQYGHTVKNYQVRVVPVSDELRDKLLPFIKLEGICFPVYNTGEKYSDEGPKRSLKNIYKNAEIPKKKRMGWHEFRHTFASRLIQNNVPIYKVSKWLGHSNITVTQIYAHFAPVYDLDIEKLSVAGGDVEQSTACKANRSGQKEGLVQNILPEYS